MFTTCIVIILEVKIAVTNYLIKFLGGGYVVVKMPVTNY